MRRLLIALVAVFLFLPACALALPEIAPVETRLSENASLRYPQLTGLESADAQRRINDDIVLSADVTRFFPVLMRQTEASFGLNMDYEAALYSDIFCVKLSAKGEMPEGGEGNRLYALCYDLRTGNRLTLDELFVSPAEAIKAMEDMLSRTLADEISGYMEASELSPLPVDSFYLDQTGITFCYPESQLLFLSGYAGQARFSYWELKGLLDDSEDGLLARNGLLPKAYTAQEAKRLITETLSGGRLPELPVAIGDGMGELIETYRLLRDPDMQPGGRVYQLESPEFRCAQIISDALTGGYAASVVEGIQTTRCSLYGLQTGVSARSDCRSALGAPESSVPFTQAMAFDYALPLGSADYYSFGAYQLRLYFDQTETLYSVMLTK